MRKLRRTVARFLVASFMAAQIASMMPVNTFAADPAKMYDVYEGNTGMVTVVSVNGNKLQKADIVKIGDTVTWDVIVTPGNTALMKSFKDELPEGIKFEPNSEKAFTVFAVNDDGSLGRDITAEGKIVIDGRTFTWTPENPNKYFFSGKGSTNRLLFHITSVVEHSVKPDTVLENTGTIEFNNPKGNTPPPLSDKASVKIPATPETPVIRKSVYKEDASGNVPARLPSNGTVNETADKKFSISTDDVYSDMKKNVGDFIREADKYKIDTKELSELLVNLNENSDAAYKQQIVTAFKAAVLKYNTAVAQELKDTGHVDDLEKLKNEVYQSSENADSITLDKIEEKYTYVMNLLIPSQSVSTSLEIEDFVENVQTVDAANVHVYNDRGEDVTAQGDITIKPYQYDQNKVTWTAKSEFVNWLKSTNTDKNLQMRITGVTVRDARSDDLERYRLGGVITIPNTSTVVFDNFRKDSNKTLVRTPNPPEYKDHSILKGVSAQEGKVIIGDAPYHAAGEKNAALYTKIDAFKASMKAIVENAGLKDSDKAEVLAKLEKLSEASTKEEKEALARELAAKSEKVKFDEGSNAVHLQEYKDYYRYNLNVSVHPEKINDSFVVEDMFEDIHNLKVEDVKVFDDAGKDVTDQFKMTLNKQKFTATANKELVKKIRERHTESGFQFLFYNVQLKDDDNLKAKYATDTNLITVPNKASLIIDGKPLESNVVNVSVKTKTPLKPGNDPKKPDVPKDNSKPKRPNVIGDNGKNGSSSNSGRGNKGNGGNSGTVRPKVLDIVRDSAKDVKEGVSLITRENPDIKTGVGKIFLNPLMLTLFVLSGAGIGAGVYFRTKKKDEDEVA